MDISDNNILVEEAFPEHIGEIVNMDINGQKCDCEKFENGYIFQGDILLTKEQLGNKSRLKGAGLSVLATRWTDDVVYYVINSALPNQARVTNAIIHWQNNSNIRFVVRTNQTNYIEFINSSGCWSQLGMTGGRQEIGLGNGCTTGNTIHEIGHAIGLLHEHTRTDRNNFVTINWVNIQSGASHNFQRYTDIGINGFDNANFDFGSIMIYGSFAFSNNGLPTITRLNGTTYNAQRNALSDGDIQITHVMYPSRLFIVQDESLHGVDVFDGGFIVFQNNWANSEAMTTYDNRIYIIQNGRLHRVNPGDGGWVYVGSAIWSGTEAMTTYDNRLYIVQSGRLHRVNPVDGTWAYVGSTTWNGTTGMSAFN